MNNARRNKIDHCIRMLTLFDYKIESMIHQLTSIAQLKETLDEWSQETNSIIENINSVKDEEDMAYNSIPDNLQDAKIGLDIQFALDDLSEAMDETTIILNSIDEVESIYLKSFIGNYQPDKMIDKLNSARATIESAKLSLDLAKHTR